MIEVVNFMFKFYILCLNLIFMFFTIKKKGEKSKEFF